MAYHSNGAYSGDERESRSGDDRPDSDLSDKPIYLLEHLATFTVNKETGIVYPADGMRRLLQLEKTTGIWSQKMQLCLDNQWVLIMDYETGNIIERFPASLIQEPTAFTSNNPMEMYNNILVFIVAGGSGSRSEMHIFQSQSISAVHLVEDLKQLRYGKIVTQHRDTISQPAIKSSSASSQQIMQHRDSYCGIVRSGRDVGGNVDNYNHHHETDSELGGVNDETSSTSSDKYERDVTVLNHCFDDIEKFIARLQHAAAASRELERRRRNRKSKKKDPGEGLLTLRTRPPHEKEFIDIFAKFKLSFNLLAKLKAHIHDPNAPELVHFLFTPLALIVEASSDTYYESHLPAHVLNPLLTREAVNLLINCVTSKETELWRSLGDPWVIPRDQWKSHTGSYHPVFFDGWSPDYPVVDELEHPATPTNPKRHVIETHHNFGNRIGNDIIDRGGQTTPTAGGPAIIGGQSSGDFDYEHSQQQQQQHHHHHHHHERSGSADVVEMPADGSVITGDRTGFRDFSARSDISIDSIERNGLSGASTITKTGSGNTNSNNNSAAVIQSLVGGIQSMSAINSSQTSGPRGGADDQDIEIWLDKLQARGAKVVQVTYPRTANNDKELTVVRGEYLEILDDSRKWWKARNSRGQTAHVPHTIVTPFNYTENSDVFNNPLYTQQQQQQQQHNYNKGRQNESDVPIGVQPQNSAEWVRNKHIERNTHHTHDIGNSDGVKYSTTNASTNSPYTNGNGNSSNYSNTNPSTKKHNHNNHQNQEEQYHGRHHNIIIASVPPPPPPPPPPVTPPTTSETLRRNSLSGQSITSAIHKRTLTNQKSVPGNNVQPDKNNSIDSTGNGTDMQEELKKVLTLFREKRHKFEINKTPEIYIKQTSKPREIENWLKAKGFSENVLKKLHGLNGNELFGLQRQNLENVCGPDEGKRLASQITIQRNVSGYKTARTSELQAILARAREKSEQTSH